MKIKCPFCKSVYDPEACDSQCPSCNRRLLVPIRRNTKKDVAEETYQRVVNQKTGVIVLSKSSETGKVPTPKPPPTGPISAPPTTTAPATPPPAPVPLSKDPPTLFVEKPRVAPPAPDIILKPPPKRVPVAAPTPETFSRLDTAPAPRPAPPAKPAAPAPVVPKAEREVFIGLRKTGATDWETVFRIPVNVFKIAALVPKAATQILLDHGIDIQELRKAIDHTDLIGKLLEIETTQNRVIVAIESPKDC